jgi:hypothetical protein
MRRTWRGSRFATTADGCLIGTIGAPPSRRRRGRLPVAGSRAEQRRDTPEGQAAQAAIGRDATGSGDRSCLIVTAVIVAVVLLVIWAALNSEGGMPSYWH